MAAVNTPSTLSLTHLLPPSQITGKSTALRRISFKKNPENKIRNSGSISASNSNSNGYVTAIFGCSREGGTGVLERPVFDQSQFQPATTEVLEGGDFGLGRNRRKTGSGDSYRVLLIDDARHTENLVVKALPQSVPAVTPDDARRLFQLSREKGLAVVLVTVKEHAEFYAQMMLRNGLRSTIEPDSSVV